MFKTIEDFQVIWKHESKSTLNILKALTDESLEQKVTNEGRTIGRLAWHITTSVNEMISRTGLEFEGAEHDAPFPQSAKEIAEAYELSSESMVQAISSSWSNEELSVAHDMYGEQWSVATILQVLVFHQIHHRGQLTVLMRQAGLPVIGVYGPALEDWATFGMEAPE